jgi:hypothetical protein
MEITALFKGHTAAEEGVSASGNSWRKITAIFETPGEYPKTIAFVAMNNACELVTKLQPGKTYVVSYDLQSRAYTDRTGRERWSTDAKAWGFKEPQTATQPQPKPTPVQTRLDTLPPIGTDSNDLPF